MASFARFIYVDSSKELTLLIVHFSFFGVLLQFALELPEGSYGRKARPGREYRRVGFDGLTLGL